MKKVPGCRVEIRPMRDWDRYVAYVRVEAAVGDHHPQRVRSWNIEGYGTAAQLAIDDLSRNILSFRK